MKIEVTSTEIDNRQLTVEHLSQTFQSIQKDGFVILGHFRPPQCHHFDDGIPGSLFFPYFSFELARNQF